MTSGGCANCSTNRRSRNWCCGARAADRRDVELALSCYHPDATEDHGGFKGRAVDFLREAPTGNPDHPVKQSWHGIVSNQIQFDDDGAFVETYFLAILLTNFRGRLDDAYVAGRYLSQVVRWQGEWRFRHRTLVFDRSRLDPHSEEVWQAQQLPLRALHFGVAGASDPLYAFLPRGQPVAAL